MVTATLPWLPLTTDQNKMVSPISSFLLRLNFHSMSQLNSSLGPQFAPCHGPLVPSCYSLLQPPYSEPPLQSDWTTPAPKQGNTFSPQPFTPLSAKNLPFFLSPAQLGLLFSSLNLIYFVKDRYSKPSSPLSNSWSAHDTHWEMASGRCTPYCFVCWSCLFALFLCPYKQGPWGYISLIRITDMAALTQEVLNKCCFPGEAIFTKHLLGEFPLNTKESVASRHVINVCRFQIQFNN